ncbi:winged helix-turn-helix transcriptional regulator [Halorubellus salinus]|uniref:winged helix-turn-helix transcriptional regulator n=1 Tax=Halorubellus salinus TaxID=755309 RepID=UPI001D05CA66|nr:winged helix-turn-helix transcriptional regulator [Halorubellus salinus]
MTRDEAETPAEDDEPSTRRQQAVDGFDSGIVDLLSWVLDTETRAKIYIFLQANPASTSEEIAQGTGLYPSTVREALAELHDEEKVHREKRAASGAGNNPYEYTAIAPSELVSGVVGQVQDELNTVFNLDSLLDEEEEEEEALEPVDAEDEPVTITVQSNAVDADPDAGADEADADADEADADDDATTSTDE